MKASFEDMDEDTVMIQKKGQMMKKNKKAAFFKIFHPFTDKKDAKVCSRIL